MPPFPQVALRVLELLATQEPSAAEVANALELDSAFCAKILQTANSPLLGLPREVKTIQHAITLLGNERIRAATLTVAIRGYMMKRVPKTALRPVWRHSMAAAMIAEQLAPRCSLRSELGYSVGLLHDIGRLAQIAAHAGKYLRFIDAAKHHGGDVLSLEREHFGADHCELALALAQIWQLPDDLALAATRHHSDPREQEPTVVTLTRFGCQLADVLGFYAVRPYARRRREELFQNLGDVAASLWQVDLDQLKSSVSDRVKAVEKTLSLT
ncbi:MAG: HDOD domain-containing protein [bacterium]|nr:HDOD domain-containing protein [bacterium]